MCTVCCHHACHLSCVQLGCCYLHVRMRQWARSLSNVSPPCALHRAAGRYIQHLPSEFTAAWICDSSANGIICHFTLCTVMSAVPASHRSCTLMPYGYQPHSVQGDCKLLRRNVACMQFRLNASQMVQPLSLPPFRTNSRLSRQSRSPKPSSPVISFATSKQVTSSMSQSLRSS